MNIIYEDSNIIAFNKASGLLTIPDRYDADIPNLKTEAEKKYGKLYIIHRIDKDTSGVVVFAKNEAAHKYMNQIFENRDVEKYYLAFVNGNPYPEEGLIEKPIAVHPAHNGKMIVHHKGKDSKTSYNTLEKWKGYALLQLQIFTGRTHQIRVHLQDLGYPVLCDKLYGNNKPLLLSDFKKKKYKLSINELEERPILNRLALHANKLRFKDIEGKDVEIFANMPKDMTATMSQLNKWAK